MTQWQCHNPVYNDSDSVSQPGIQWRSDSVSQPSIQWCSDSVTTRYTMTQWQSVTTQYTMTQWQSVTTWYTMTQWQCVTTWYTMTQWQCHNPVYNDAVTECHNPVYNDAVTVSQPGIQWRSDRVSQPGIPKPWTWLWKPQNSHESPHSQELAACLCHEPDKSTQPVYHQFITLLTPYTQIFEVSVPYSPLSTLLYVFVSPTSVSCPTYPILLESINEDHKTWRSLWYIVTV